MPQVRLRPDRAEEIRDILASVPGLDITFDWYDEGDGVRIKLHMGGTEMLLDRVQTEADIVELDVDVSPSGFSFLVSGTPFVLARLDRDSPRPTALPQKLVLIGDGHRIPEWAASIEEVLIIGDHERTDMSDVAGLSALSNLTLMDCSSLAHLEGFAGLGSLVALEISSCTALTHLDGLEGLSSLESLWLMESPLLTSLDGLARLPNLERLSIIDCESLRRIDVLKGLTALTALNLSRCRALTSVEALSGLSKLVSLDLRGCEALTSVDGLRGLTALTALNLSGCWALTNVEALSGLTNLTSLDLSYCESLTSIDELARLPRLTSLNLRACGSLFSPQWRERTIQSTAQKWQLANRSTTTSEQRRELADDSDWQIREAVASSRYTPQYLLTSLAGDSVPAVVAAVASNPKATPRTLRELAESHPLQVAGNPACPVDLLASLADDKSWAMTMALSFNPNTPRQILEEVDIAGDLRIRINLAGNPSLADSERRRLLGDLLSERDAFVRLWCALSPVTPVGVLNQLLADKHRNVRSTAQAKLAERNHP
jgi:internalin A